jgi:hypothetical protein
MTTHAGTVTAASNWDELARLADQFDTVLHLDEGAALEPLERWAREEADLPETYPAGQ